MIRINLLPIREIKKKEAVKRAIATYVVGVVVVCAAMVVLYMWTTGTRDKLVDQKENLTTQEATLRKQVAVVETLKKEEADLKEKLDTISKLEASRRGPVKVMEELSKRLPPEKAYLTELSHSGGKLTVSGYALDNETIALFMANLDPKADDATARGAEGNGGDVSDTTSGASAGGNNIFSNVELVSTQQEIRNDVTLKKFSLNCTVNLAAPAAKAAEGNDG